MSHDIHVVPVAVVGMGVRPPCRDLPPYNGTCLTMVPAGPGTALGVGLEEGTAPPGTLGVGGVEDQMTMEAMP